MEDLVFVHVELDGETHLAGRLWARNKNGRENASFEYDAAWLARKDKFALEPSLELGQGQLQTKDGQPLFGAIGDSAPDTWGRKLMRRHEHAAARRERRAARTLGEADFLLLVDDEIRQGALRFSRSEQGPFLAPPGKSRIPPLVKLPRLLAAAENLDEDSENAEDLRLLLAPGSSLGGARPKASVIDRQGRLAIAKFPRKDDDFDTVRWEALALRLAEKAGIQVPEWKLEFVAEKPVLLLTRFDRIGNRRIPFLSALSMLGAKDMEPRSYPEIAECFRWYGDEPQAQMSQLWRRMIFNILISNTDDHLRNHGFLYHGPRGWKLSPAYDMNPVPTELRPRIMATAIVGHDTRASLDSAIKASEYFDLKIPQALAIAREVGTVVSGWKSEAGDMGIGAREIKRMGSAFNHEDARLALAL